MEGMGKSTREYEPLSEGLAWLRGVCERREIPIIRRDTEQAMTSVLRHHRPERILEIGTALGYSACFMATVCENAKITTVEISERSYWDAKEAIERLGFSDRIRQILGDGREAEDALLEEGCAFDFVFIDAAKSHYKEYFDGALPMLTPGGLILCDNVLLSGQVMRPLEETPHRDRTSVRNMQTFLDYIQDLPFMESGIFTIGDGISMSLDLTDKESETETAEEENEQ